MLLLLFMIQVRAVGDNKPVVLQLENPPAIINQIKSVSLVRVRVGCRKQPHQRTFRTVLTNKAVAESDVGWHGVEQAVEIKSAIHPFQPLNSKQGVSAISC
jgi:hypothetical protein